MGTWTNELARLGKQLTNNQHTPALGLQVLANKQQFEHHQKKAAQSHQRRKYLAEPSPQPPKTNPQYKLLLQCPSRQNHAAGCFLPGWCETVGALWVQQHTELWQQQLQAATATEGPLEDPLPQLCHQLQSITNVQTVYRAPHCVRDAPKDSLQSLGPQTSLPLPANQCRHSQPFYSCMSATNSCEKQLATGTGRPGHAGRESLKTSV